MWGEVRGQVGVDTGVCPKRELPDPAQESSPGGVGLQDFRSSCLWVTLGGREAPGSFSFRQEAACSYLPCTSCTLCPEVLGGALAWRAPQVGTVPPAADKEALAESLAPSSAPQLASWALENFGVQCP